MDYSAFNPRRSVARKVTRRVSLLLLIATLILFAVAYYTVSSVIRSKNESQAMASLGIFSDLIVNDSYDRQIPVDQAHAEHIILLGEEVCDWSGADYIYVYTIDEENSSVTYVAIASVDGRTKANAADHLVGLTVHCELLPEELSIWHGEKTYGHITSENSYGYEISTLRLIEDAFGNRLIAGVDISYVAVSSQILRTFFLLAAFILVVLFGVYLAVNRIVRRRVSEPAQALSRTMLDYISDGNRSVQKLDESGDDEYAMIASAFNVMTDNVDRYLENIQTLTQKQAQSKTELEIAARIQKGILPEPHLYSPTCEIHACMSPAKDIGGDLYDYLPLDDSRVLVVIADVSGKGIPAAMFMAVTLLLIRQNAKNGLSPAQILEKTNASLCEKNAAMLFTTAFLGIYDSKTRRFTYSNAGHNPPFLIGNSVRPLHDAAGTLLGLFESESYTQAELQLDVGETILLYTDGVTEAVDPDRQFFGISRLEDVLLEAARCRAADPVAFVKDRVHAFENGSEQHDDITMLSLTAKDSMELLLRFDTREFQKIKAALLLLPLPRKDRLNLCLAAEECFVNICSYTFGGAAPEDERIRFCVSAGDRIEIRFEDCGQPFNPLTDELPDPDEYDPDLQMGGLGRLISFSIVDDAKYEYRDHKNILTLTKYYEEAKQ